MHLPISPEVTAIISQAYAAGVETSLVELADLLECSDGGTLVAATAVVDRVAALELELLPGPSVGSFSDVRVLRRASTTTGDVEGARGAMEGGESAGVEFKESLMCSMHHVKQGLGLVDLPQLPGEVLKTICAFLNTDGGELLVGVQDDGSSCDGITRDLELKGWNLDKWQLHFASLIEGRFYGSGSVTPYMRTHMLRIDADPVFHVEVMPRSTRSFVRREKGKEFEFFIRHGPRTLTLDLPAFYAHMYLQS